MRSQSREGDLAMGRRKKSGGGAAWSLYRLLVNITLTAQFLNTKPIRHSLKWPLVLFIFGLVSSKRNWWFELRRFVVRKIGL